MANSRPNEREDLSKGKAYKVFLTHDSFFAKSIRVHSAAKRELREDSSAAGLSSTAGSDRGSQQVSGPTRARLRYLGKLRDDLSETATRTNSLNGPPGGPGSPSTLCTDSVPGPGSPSHWHCDSVVPAAASCQCSDSDVPVRHECGRNSLEAEC